MGPKPKILVVDDDMRNLQLLGNLLKSRYNLTVALNGKQALSELDHYKPDLILLDVMMPALNGYKVCELIKKDEKLKEIPIIFLTAKSENADIIHGFQIGASDYVMKPFNHVELLARIHTQIELSLSRKRIRELENDILRLRRELGEI